MPWSDPKTGQTYISGGRKPAKRLLLGVVMLALGVALAVIFSYTAVSRGWYLGLFLPFWMGTLGLSQARKKT
ncbi:MAG TPA: hypothetical protein VHM64_12895 [Candidatus Binatia bacterium]|nr:hypothetical protein [Candidatus Binatia bacterium]